jgi:hypothetical protein
MKTKIIKDSRGRLRVLGYDAKGQINSISKFGDALDQEIKDTQKKEVKRRNCAKGQKLRVHERLVRSKASPMSKISKQVKNMSKSDMMIAVAKGVENGRPTTIEKRLWYKEIAERAEALRHEGQNAAGAFSKFITTNPDGQLLFAVYKQAPGRDWEGDDEEELEEHNEEEQDNDDPAYSKLAAVAKDLMKSNPTLSFPSAFAKAVNLHPALMKASTAVHRARIAKSYEGKPNVPSGETGNQHPGLSQYQELMERARQIQLEGGSGRSVASIFSELYQNKGQMVPGPDKGKKGADKATRLQQAERQTETRLRTEKRFNAAQPPIRVEGAEGYSFKKA